MDPVDVVRLARSLIDIDSTTGREGEACRWLAAYLRERGYLVTEQVVGDDRVNLLAGTAGVPAVVLSTHIDCVPPFVPSRLENGRLYGRGACDAKGILAAQVAAAERLRAADTTGVGLLFVVGEERGSDGALAANSMAVGSRYLIDGEPTDLRLARATRGVLRVRLTASGRAAHSSYPELGESAIDKLLDALMALRGIELPSHPSLGRTHYTIGLIAGGVAPNVVSPSADAEVLFRTIGPSAEVRARLEPLARWVTVEQVLEVPPIEMYTVNGFETAVFPFTTDVPLLGSWGTPLLYGPGSVHVAHTVDEWLSIDELHAAVQGYERLVRQLTAS